MQMSTLAERDALAEIFADRIKDIPMTPPRGHRMPDTEETWQHLAELYSHTIVLQKTRIERLKRTINQLRQKVKRGK